MRQPIGWQEQGIATRAGSFAPIGAKEGASVISSNSCGKLTQEQSCPVRRGDTDTTKDAVHVAAQALLVSTPHKPPPGLPLPNLNWEPTDRSLDTTVFKSLSLGSAEESGVRAQQGSGGTPSHPCFSQAKSPGGNPSKSTGRALIHSSYGRLIIYGLFCP